MMKVKTVGYLAVAGMLLTSISVWSLAGPKPRPSDGPTAPSAAVLATPPSSFSGAEFSTGQTLRMDGRLGHARLLADREGHTYLFVNVVAPAEVAASARIPLNLAIVIDRSGSMRGKRLLNAQRAARGAIQRLRDGDVLSIVTYDTETDVVLPSTVIDSDSRARATVAIDGIVARGDTCISCGVDAGRRMLEARSNMVDRVLLLSDGEPTAGIRDLDGFRALAQRVRNGGASISSIGVDVEYNERTLAVLAQESNGRHYFAESASELSRAFDSELDSLVRTVAQDAELVVDLGPGVEIEEVFDRSFRREGQRAVVPFGTFAAGEEKTFLARVRIDRGADGERRVAGVTLSFADTTSGARGECVGRLSLLATADASELEPLDPIVAARLQRSDTARTLTEANQLFSAGRAEVAQRRLRDKIDELKRERKAAVLAAPSAHAPALDRDFERQERALGAASEGFAEPPPPASSPAGAAPAKPAELRKGKAQVRANQKQAVDLAF
jgi:Ca-activated chloride channel family protein